MFYCVLNIGCKQKSGGTREFNPLTKPNWALTSGLKITRPSSNRLHPQNTFATPEIVVNEFVAGLKIPMFVDAVPTMTTRPSGNTHEPLYL